VSFDGIKRSVYDYQFELRQTVEELDNTGSIVDFLAKIYNLEIDVSDDVLNRINVLVENIIVSSLDEANFCRAFEYLRVIGDLNRIKKIVSDTGFLFYNRPHIDLFRYIFYFADESEFDSLISQYIYHDYDSNYFCLNHFFQNFSNFDVSILNIFNEICDIVYKFYPNVKKNTFGIDQVNAVVEMCKSEVYDLVIAVMNGGNAMGCLFDAIGFPVQFHEWHRDWKIDPRLNRRVAYTDVSDACDSVLICEDDAVTGLTLSKIQNMIRSKFLVSRLDVCFSVYDFPEIARSSVELVDAQLDFTNVLSVYEFSVESVYSNLKFYRDLLLSNLLRNSPLSPPLPKS